MIVALLTRFLLLLLLLLSFLSPGEPVSRMITLAFLGYTSESFESDLSGLISPTVNAAFPRDLLFVKVFFFLRFANMAFETLLSSTLKTVCGSEIPV